MSIKLPHMPLWVYDLEADEDCSLMTLAEYGAYIRLLQRQWIEGNIPNETERLARLLRVTPDEFDSIWQMIGTKFREEPDTGRLANPRLAEERDRCIQKALKNRENGKKGGRPPKNRKDNPEETERLSESKPNGSIRAYGSGSGYGSVSSKGRSAEEGGVDLLFPEGAECLDTQAFRDQWGEWLAYRREKRWGLPADITVKTQFLKLAKVGHDQAIETIKLSISNDWRGLFPEKGAGGAGGQAEAAAQERRKRKRAQEHPDDADLTL